MSGKQTASKTPASELVAEDVPAPLRYTMVQFIKPIRGPHGKMLDAATQSKTCDISRVGDDVCIMDVDFGATVVVVPWGQVAYAWSEA